VQTCPCGHACWEEPTPDAPATSASLPVPAADTSGQDPDFASALEAFAPPASNGAGPAANRVADSVSEPQVTTGVIPRPEERPVPSATSPATPAWPAGTPTATLPWGLSEEKHVTLRGKLEVGLEHGTWNLRYEPEPAGRPGGLVRLVAPQPLCGCHAGWAAVVEGYLTSFGKDLAFQVDRLTVGPPPARPALPAVLREGAPAPAAGRRSLVGRLEPGIEPGRWNLIYYSDLERRRPVGVVRLVADHPLYGLREGREVRVDGYVTRAGFEQVFQVESIAVAPPR
jgi:hypothetical protein